MAKLTLHLKNRDNTLKDYVEEMGFDQTISRNLVQVSIEMEETELATLSGRAAPVISDLLINEGDYVISTFVIPHDDQHGHIYPSGAVGVMPGETITFNVVPDYGYEIDTLLIDGDPVTPAYTHTFTDVHADHTITASFKLVEHVIVPTIGDNGAIVPGKKTDVTHGDHQTFTITADEGYVIEDVVVDGVSIGPVTSYTFTKVGDNHTIAATFIAE